MVNAAPTVLRPAEGPIEAVRFTRCPVAEVRQPGGWVGRLLTIASQHRAGVALRDVVQAPTAALTEGLAVLDGERMQVEAYDRRQAAERADRQRGA